MGYTKSSLGDAAYDSARTYCASKFDPMSKDFLPCINHYVSGKPGNYVGGGGGGSSFFTDIMSAFKPPAAPPTGTPPILAPVATGMSQNTKIAIGMGAIGLLALVLVSRK